MFNIFKKRKNDFPDIPPYCSPELAQVVIQHHFGIKNKNPNKSIYKTFTLRELCELIGIDNINFIGIDGLFVLIDEYIKRNTYLKRPVEFFQFYNQSNQFYYIFKFNLYDIDIDRLEFYRISEYKHLYEQ